MEESWSTVARKKKGKTAREESETLQEQYHTNSDISDDDEQPNPNSAPTTVVGESSGTAMEARETGMPGHDRTLTMLNSNVDASTGGDYEHAPNPATRKFRSPWMKKALMFHEDPTFTKEELIIPHFKNLNRKGNTLFLQDSDFVPIEDGWGICLLGIFAGRFPGREAVNQLMSRWPSKAKVSFHRKGWMLFQFASERDRELTRQKGPFSQYGIPLILQPVPKNFRLGMEPEINIPVWVRLTDLELFFWHEEMVGKIASCIGTPIAVDFPSLEKKGMDWLRVQIIIDASTPPLHELNLEA